MTNRSVFTIWALLAVLAYLFIISTNTKADSESISVSNSKTQQVPIYRQNRSNHFIFESDRHFGYGLSPEGVCRIEVFEENQPNDNFAGIEVTFSDSGIPTYACLCFTNPGNHCAHARAHCIPGFSEDPLTLNEPSCHSGEEHKGLVCKPNPDGWCYRDLVIDTL